MNMSVSQVLFKLIGIELYYSLGYVNDKVIIESLKVFE